MSSPPLPQAEVVRTGRVRRGLAARLVRRLGAMNMAAAAGILGAAAALVAFAAYGALAALRGSPFGVADGASAAAVALLVGAPLIALALTALRRQAESRRALRQATERLALAVSEADRANRTKTQFLANMSHELRTPLNAIIGFADLIQAQKLGRLGDPRYLDYVKDIAQSGHHLLHIINDILDLAKIEAGGADTRDEEEFNLDAVADATLRMMRPIADRQGVALELAGDFRGLRLLGVERMVCQILLNLLSNAVKFTPSAGRVTLTAARNADGTLSLAVADTGLGMSAAEIAVALTPFGQVDNAMSRKHSGTGLGLPLAKAMMELHGGSLSVASVPGSGTTVSLVYPASRVVRRAPAAARVPANAEVPVTRADPAPLRNPANRAA